MTAAELRHSLRNGHPGQTPAPAEHAVRKRDALLSAPDVHPFNAGQGGAVGKGVAAGFPDRVGNAHRGQARCEKGVAADGRHAVRNLHRRQVGAGMKSGVANGGHALFNHHFPDTVPVPWDALQGIGPHLPRSADGENAVLRTRPRQMLPAGIARGPRRPSQQEQHQAKRRHK